LTLVHILRARKTDTSSPSWLTLLHIWVLQKIIGDGGGVQSPENKT
jgi:hypothetical protein